jgi:hypothetical protein
MTRELVDRMRTCAAAIEASQTSGNPWDLALLGSDAARLLTEAADLLDQPKAPEPLGEPMERLVEILPQSPGGVGKPMWGDALSPYAPKPCPSCGSVAIRTVRRLGRGRMQLTCPVCEHPWELTP